MQQTLHERTMKALAITQPGSANELGLTQMDDKCMAEV